MRLSGQSCADGGEDCTNGDTSDGENNNNTNNDNNNDNSSSSSSSNDNTADDKRKFEQSNDWKNDSDWDETMSQLRQQIRDDEPHFRSMQSSMRSLDSSMDDLMAQMDEGSFAKDLIEGNSTADHHSNRDVVVEDEQQQRATPLHTDHAGAAQRQAHVYAHAQQQQQQQQQQDDIRQFQQQQQQQQRSNGHRQPFRRYGPFQEAFDYLFGSCKCIRC